MAEVNADVKKRRAERRKKIVKRRLTIAFIFLMVVTVIVLAIMCLTVFFPVLNVRASGSKIYTSTQIVKASGINEETNLFTVSEKGIEEVIKNKLPYVDTVTLKRELPDTISLEISDAKEYAAVGQEGLYFVISESGFVLNSYEEIPQNTFLLNAGNAICKVGTQINFKDSQKADLAYKIAEALQKSKIKINSIDVTSSVNITVRVCDRFDVKLGTEENLEKKILHLGGMIKSIGDRGGQINLSMWSESHSEGSFVPEK